MIYCKVVKTANLYGLRVGDIIEISTFTGYIRYALEHNLEMPIAESYPCP